MAWASAFERRPLPQLLEQHRDTVAFLQEELGDALDATALLRYALSFPQRPAALQAARRALAWRREHQATVEAARRRQPPPGLTREELQALQGLLLAGFHGATRYGDPIFVIRAGVTNQQQVLEAVGDEKLELWVSYLNERLWLFVDAFQVILVGYHVWHRLFGEAQLVTSVYLGT